MVRFPNKTRFFFISNNNLSGEISSLICNVSSLIVLDLSHNNLSGIIPQCFVFEQKPLNVEIRAEQGCELNYLNLHGNLLEGLLTQSIINCQGLEVLDLGNNKINDTFAHWLRSLAQLQSFVLRSNKFQGSFMVLGPVIHSPKSKFLTSQIITLMVHFLLNI
ncbi:Leucine-rich repeat - like 10 [Theobroma cacao]|nr:Leucine-rich repeat - like 10 [Theobroma cacao]